MSVDLNLVEAIEDQKIQRAESYGFLFYDFYKFPKLEEINPAIDYVTGTRLIYRKRVMLPVSVDEG